ncbi:MAG: lipase family protein [Oscillospiraceae bacterium]|jgi:predicted lipase|nr:lipase family protein [Oscillospiraceae bacterium]
MNSGEILRTLEFSTSAYRDVQPYTPHTCTAMIDNPQSGVQYFLRRDGDTLWITFRGSDSPRDWKTNLSVCKKGIPYDNTETKIRVHTGFLNAYKSTCVRSLILAEITPDTHYIKISGHSLGAALAVLCAVDVQYNFPGRDIEVFLFGCPRVGNRAFALSYNKRVDKTVRVENGNDIVTKVPPALWGYRHVGARLHVGAPRLAGLYVARDHYPHRYYAGVLKKYVL